MTATDATLPLDDREAIRLLRQTAGQPPANAHLDNGPWDWLRRLDAAVIDARVRPMLRELVLDGDQIVRLRALELITELHRDDATFAAAFSAVSQHPERFAAPELARAAQHLLAAQAKTGEEARVSPLLRRLAGSRTPSVSAASILAIHEPEYTLTSVASHTSDMDAERFAVRAASTFAVYHRDQLLALLAKLRPMAEGTRRQALAEVEEMLAVPAPTIATLTQQQSLAPPTFTPTIEACRTALGL